MEGLHLSWSSLGTREKKSQCMLLSMALEQSKVHTEWEEDSVATEVRKAGNLLSLNHLLLFFTPVDTYTEPCGRRIS